MPIRKHLLDGLVELGVEEEDLVEARRLDLLARLEARRVVARRLDPARHALRRAVVPLHRAQADRRREHNVVDLARGATRDDPDRRYRSASIVKRSGCVLWMYP